MEVKTLPLIQWKYEHLHGLKRVKTLPWVKYVGDGVETVTVGSRKLP